MTSVLEKSPGGGPPAFVIRMSIPESKASSASATREAAPSAVETSLAIGILPGEKLLLLGGVLHSFRRSLPHIQLVGGQQRLHILAPLMKRPLELFGLKYLSPHSKRTYRWNVLY